MKLTKNILFPVVLCILFLALIANFISVQNVASDNFLSVKSGFMNLEVYVVITAIVSALMLVVLMTLGIDDSSFHGIKFWFREMIISGLSLIGFYYWSLRSSDEFIVLLSDKMTHVFSIFLVFGFLGICVIISRYKVNKFLKYFVNIFNFVLVGLIIFTDFFINTTYITDKDFAFISTSGGILYPIFGIVLLLYLVVAFFVVIKSYYLLRNEVLKKFGYFMIFFAICLVSLIFMYVYTDPSPSPFALLFVPSIFLAGLAFTLSRLDVVSFKRNSILISLTFVSLLVVGMFVVNDLRVTNEFKDFSENYFVESKQAQVSILSHFLFHYFENMADEMRILSNNIVVDTNFPRVTNLFENNLSKKEYISILYLDSEYNTIFNIGHNQNSDNLKSLSYMFSNNQTTVNYLLSDDGTYYMYVASPAVIDVANSRTQGHLLSVINATFVIHNSLDHLNFDSPNIFLLDESGVVVFDGLINSLYPKQESNYHYDYLLEDMANKTLWNGSGFFVRTSKEGEDNYVFYKTENLLGHNLSVVKVWPVSSAYERMETFFLRNVLTTAFLVIMIILLGMVSNFIINRSLRAEIKQKTYVIESKLKKEAKTSQAMAYLLKKVNANNQQLIDEGQELNKLYRQKKKWSKDLEEQVQERTKELTDANAHISELLKRKTDFLNRVSHDLRTPLTPIRLITELILKTGKIDPNSRDNLKRVMRNIDSLEYLVKDVLNLVRLERGSEQFVFELQNINDAIYEHLDMRKDIFKRKKVEVYQDLGKVPDTIIDKNKMIELFDNVLSNTIKHANVPKIKITIKTRLKGKNIEVIFSDNGKGVKKDSLNKLFEEFFMNSQYQGGESTGLGLSICKKIVEAHKGRIYAKNNPSGGLSIVFTIPVKKRFDKKFFSMAK